MKVCRPMKVIFDTNVVVSAALKDRAPEEIILFVVESADFQWVAAAEIVPPTPRTSTPNLP
jgi:uncharacterized protein